MSEYSGFWSYVREDDAADKGRILQLLHDIVAEYEMLSADTIEVFADRDSLAWGNEWQARINTSLASVAFFIPILTPRYFTSAACLFELNTFARKATELGVNELLMPILYMNFPGVEEDEPSDEAVALVRRFHWVDWRDKRFADVTSNEYRRGVAEMAARIFEANQAAERASVTDSAAELPPEEQEGVIELLARFEEALPEVSETAQHMGAAIAEIGPMTEDAGAELQDPANQTFAKRLNSVRKFANKLADPSSRLKAYGDDFTRQLHDVDLGVRAVIERAPDEPESASEFCRFFEQIRELVDSAESGLGNVEVLSDSLAPLEKLSRELRAPIRDLRAGLTRMIEGRDVMRPWIQLIDQSGVDCSAA